MEKEQVAAGALLQLFFFFCTAVAGRSLRGEDVGRPEGSAGSPLLSAMAFSLLALFFLISSVSSLPQPVARVFLSFGDLKGSQSFEHFSISDKAMDYRILHMDEDQDRMYVGCKDHVLSMDLNNITHGTLKLFWPASTSKIQECQMAGKDSTGRPEASCGSVEMNEG